ncbi:MAG: hypothetical protein DRP35_07285 [Candidatus Zixiibacteriota bacterium]|nr:MAG: hypothetical protein DRP35_07285 [candidate division Zixibacteria bacterium]
MGRIKLSTNFYLDEYIPPALYKKYAAKHPNYLIGILDKNLILADQKLRDIFGPIKINTWYSGGDRQWSGIRTPDSSYYKQFSQHSWGRASDKIFLKVTSDEVREYIKKHWQELGITAIEKGVSWVHSDVRQILSQTEIFVFGK